MGKLRKVLSGGVWVIGVEEKVILVGKDVYKGREFEISVSFGSINFWKVLRFSVCFVFVSGFSFCFSSYFILGKLFYICR